MLTFCVAITHVAKDRWSLSLLLLSEKNGPNKKFGIHKSQTLYEHTVSCITHNYANYHYHTSFNVSFMT